MTDRDIAWAVINADTHGTTSDGEPYCESCGVCDEGWRCRCCLAAEVEALRVQVSEERDLRLAAQTRADAAEDQMEDVAKVIAALRAQVQRVRELRDRFRDHEKWASYRNVETLLTRALDGDA